MEASRIKGKSVSIFSDSVQWRNTATTLGRMINDVVNRDRPIHCFRTRGWESGAEAALPSGDLSWST